MKVFKNISELTGNTPLIRLNKLNNNNDNEIFLKLETQNPSNSIKDRLGLALLNDAERRGIINEHTIIIEPSSGNTGISLAMHCAVRKIRLIIVMPENMSIERRKIISSFGAEIILSSSSEGMPGAIKKAALLKTQIPGSILLSQFENTAGIEIHKNTTAVEIWNDTDGKTDIVVAGVGTGSTLTGVAAYLKSRNSSVKAVAVEPAESPVLSGGTAAMHRIQGIGAGFVPEILDFNCIDEIIRVGSKDAMDTSLNLIKDEGILCGISSGANVFAALMIAERSDIKNKKIVTFICDSYERYLSTL